MFDWVGLPLILEEEVHLLEKLTFIMNECLLIRQEGNNDVMVSLSYLSLTFFSTALFIHKMNE